MTTASHSLSAGNSEKKLWGWGCPTNSFFAMACLLPLGRPSRRRQQKAAPQGERFCSCVCQIVSVHPEEVPFSGPSRRVSLPSSKLPQPTLAEILPSSGTYHGDGYHHLPGCATPSSIRMCMRLYPTAIKHRPPGCAPDWCAK